MTEKALELLPWSPILSRLSLLVMVGDVPQILRLINAVPVAKTTTQYLLGNQRHQSLGIMYAPSLASHTIVIGLMMSTKPIRAVERLVALLRQALPQFGL
jgi:hypothetical protein